MKNNQKKSNRNIVAELRDLEIGTFEDIEEYILDADSFSDVRLEDLSKEDLAKNYLNWYVEDKTEPKIKINRPVRVFGMENFDELVEIDHSELYSRSSDIELNSGDIVIELVLDRETLKRLFKAELFETLPAEISEQLVGERLAKLINLGLDSLQ